MEINWSLLQPVDIGGNFQAGFRMGEQLVRKERLKSALDAYSQNPTDPQAVNALAAASPEFAYKMAAERAELAAKAQAKAAERQRIGGILTEFDRDPQAARRAALEGGDIDLAKQLTDLEADQQKRVVSMYKGAAPIAYKLRQTSDPTERSALFSQARPILEAQGWSPQLLDQFDVTDDRALDTIIASAQTVDQLIDQNKIVWHQVGERPSFATNAQGMPIGSANPYSAAVGGSSAPVAAGPAQGAVASTLSTSLPAPVVAGFLGNFHVEGGYGGARGDGGSSHGIAQWRGERQTNFQKVIGKPVLESTPDEQARFVLWEMQNPEAAGMTVAQRDEILAAQTPEQAAHLIDRYYERSDGKNRDKRMAAASAFGGGPVKVASKAEFDGLPSGTRFIAPDGSERIKP